MHAKRSPCLLQQRRVRRHAFNADAFQFFNLLTGPDLLEQVESLQPEHRERLFPPTETLSMFLSQAMSADRSCQQAVDDAAVKRIVGDLPRCSTHTGAYCRARLRLPTAMAASLVRHTGRLIASQSPLEWRWQDRPVRLVDGTTIPMPDTEANQAAFPQPRSQSPGMGFPLCRLVGLLSLDSGAVLDAAIAPFRGKGNDEQSMLRSLLGALNPGDVLLGDAYYATYFLLCDLQQRGVDGTFEQYGARKRSTDFRRGQRLGPRDHLIVIRKPPKKPAWMSTEDYDQTPDTLTVRELHAGGKILVTTLLCPRQMPKADVRALYRSRWHIELDLRSIKTCLGMEILSCKTPDMAIKEIWIYLLAYNLIRLMMAQAAIVSNCQPREISFKHTLQIWLAWQQRTPDITSHSLATLFTLIAQQRVGNRPGRVEPRAVKRRPKQYALLNRPRAQLRAEIRQHGHPSKVK